jgi:predicted ArsR family transcriptional regulator
MKLLKRTLAGKREPVTCNELADELGWTVANTRAKLVRLRKAGKAQYERDGRLWSSAPPGPETTSPLDGAGR